MQRNPATFAETAALLHASPRRRGATARPSWPAARDPATHHRPPDSPASPSTVDCGTATTHRDRAAFQRLPRPRIRSTGGLLSHSDRAPQEVQRPHHPRVGHLSLSLPPPTHTHTHKARCPPRSRTPAPPTSTQLRHGLDLAQGLQTVRKTFPAPCLRPGDVLCRGRDDAVQGGGLECGFQRGERLPCRGRRQRCSFCPRPAGFEYAYPCTNVYWAQSGQGGTGEAS